MNIPFAFSVSPGAATAAQAGLFDQTANLILAGIIAAAVGGGSTAFAKLADFNLGAIDTTGPTVNAAVLAKKAFYMRSISITVSAACRVRFGVFKTSGSVFAPVYETEAGEAAAGGIVREFRSGPLVPNDGTTWNAAFEITPDAAGTVRVSGDVEIQPVNNLAV